MKPFLFLISLYVALGAQSQKPTKTFIPPKVVEYVSDPLLAKDDGCARDYALAIAATGLEQRKQIAELITYGCIEPEPIYGIYRVYLHGSRSIMVAGKPTQILQVELVAVPIDGISNSKSTASGWIVIAKASEAPEKVRAACSTIHQSTYRKKQSDLTTTEEQQVRACQALGMYDAPR